MSNEIGAALDRKRLQVCAKDDPPEICTYLLQTGVASLFETLWLLLSIITLMVLQCSSSTAKMYGDNEDEEEAEDDLYNITGE